MRFSYKKRGLSTIVATLLIILLTLVAVGIIWVVIKNVLNRGAEEIELGKFTLGLEIKRVQVQDNTLGVTVERNSGEGEFVGLRFVVGDGENSEVFTEYTPLTKLQSKIFYLTLATINPDDITSIKVAPIFELESGKEQTGEVKDEYLVGTSGLNVIESPPVGIPLSACGVISTGGDYILTTDVSSSGTCFTITAENVNLNCYNHWINYSITGAGSTYGIYSNKVNTTVRNCNILDANITSQGFSRPGICFQRNNYSTISNNFIITGNSYGIWLFQNADFNTVTGNTITSNDFGIWVFQASNNNLITDNTVTSDLAEAIMVELSSYNTITGNDATSNQGNGIGLLNSQINTLSGNSGTSNANSSGIDLYSSSNNTLTNNNGTSLGGGSGVNIYSCLNVNLTSNYAYSNSWYGIGLMDSNSSFLMNNIARSVSSRAISLYRSDNNTLRNNNASTSGVGIYLRYSDNNTLINNNGGSSANRAFQIEESFNNILTSNTGTSSANDGLLLYQSNNSILTNNTFTTSSASAYGVNLWIVCTNNTFMNNIISGGLMGIYIQSSSNNNTFINNTITSPEYAIFIQSSSNNKFIGQTARATGASGYGVYFFGAGNSLFRDCVNVSGLSYDVYYGNAAGNVNNTFINCPYASTNSSKEYVQGAGSQLIRKWYYQAHVNSSSGDVASATVIALNSSGANQFTQSTDSSGWITRQEVIDYVNTGGTRRYYSDYNVTASKTGYVPDSNIFNLTTQKNKLDDEFFLS